MSIKIAGGASGNLLEVNSDKAAQVCTPLDSTKCGFAALACESDAGTVLGSRTVRTVDISQDYRIRTGIDSPLFNAKFPGSAIHTGLWNQIASTQTIVVGSGFCTLNAGLSVASGTYSQIRTYRCFPIFGTFGLWFQCTFQLTQAPVANNSIEIGGFLAAAATAPTDGVFLRINASGEARLVMNFAGTETLSPAFDATTLIGVNKTHLMSVGCFDNNIEMWLDDVLVASVAMPAAQGDVTASAMVPFAARVINVGATATAQVLKIGTVNVTFSDGNIIKPWAHTLAGMGNMGYEGQAGSTLGTTALYTNSLAAGAGAAATNTTAALGSGLGGQFSLQPTLTAGTDGVISSYQVPAATSALPGKSLYITGIKIVGVVTTALTGGPVIAAWSLAYGHTSVSLATSEAAGTKAPRRVPLGLQVFAATAAVGARDDREVWMTFETPICVQPGEFVQTVLKNLGTVTSAGVITFEVVFDAYWE